MIIWIWIGFIAIILALLAIDLGVFHKKDHVIGAREAVMWTGLWIALAMGFNVLVGLGYEWHWFGLGTDPAHPLEGRQAALEFFAAYLVEKSLSLDNIFVIAMIFSYFAVPLQYQHRVLFWGILGALVLRGIMILAGTALLHRFEWLTYVFGVLLLLTAVRLLIARHDNLDPNRNPLVRLAKRYLLVTDDYHGHHFFTRIDGKRAVTPLFLVLIFVESSDVMFAVDSIPACFAVTWDPFIVFSSNIFAILGLRSLYFFLAAVMTKFRYLKMSLVFLLAFVGMKMLLAHYAPIPTGVSLAFIAGILGVGVLASWVGSNRDTAALASPLPAPLTGDIHSNQAEDRISKP